MTRQEAIDIYLNKYRFSYVVINRLMQWNCSLSVRENSEIMKLNYPVTCQLVRRFKLKYKNVGRGNNYRGLK